MNPGHVTWCRVGIKRERLALDQFDRAILERADAQLWPLQIDENRRRAAGFFLQRADRGDDLGMTGMIAMTHIDAKCVGTGAVQRRDHLGIRARRAKRRQDAHLALAGGKTLDHKCSEPIKSWGRLRRRVAPGKASHV